MNVIREVKQLIQSLPDTATPDEIRIWKHQVLAILESTTPAVSTDPGEPMLHARLSPREHQVMGMLLEGRRLKEIAARLDISVKTVTTHRARLLRKLSIEDNMSLYRYAVRNGLMSV